MTTLVPTTERAHLQSAAPRRALLLAYYYPPCGGIPVMRWLRFSRNLPRRGWICDVLTQRAGSDDYFQPDPSLLSQVPAEATLHRVEDPAQVAIAFLNRRTSVRWGPWLDRLAKLVPVPDDKIGWGLGVKRYVRRHRARLTGYDVLIATGYPWTSLVIAPFLKRLLGLPLLADLRDPWSHLPGVRVGRWLHARMESRALHAADVVCVISEGMRNSYAELYPDIADRLAVVYNGIDFSVTPPQAPNSLAVERAIRANRPLRVLYSGSLLDQLRPKPYQRTLIPFLHALVTLRERQPALFARVAVQVQSNAIPRTRAYAAKLGLEGQVQFSEGRVPFDEVQRAQREADVLVLVSTSDPAYDRMVMTGKIFEYIAAARPILAMCTAESDVGRTVLRHDLGEVATSPDGAASALGRLVEPDEQFWRRFEPGVQAAQAEFDVERQLDRMEGLLTQISRAHVAR